MASDTTKLTATACEIHDALKREMQIQLRLLRRHPDRLELIEVRIETLVDFADSLDWAAITKYGTWELAQLRREISEEGQTT